MCVCVCALCVLAPLAKRGAAARAYLQDRHEIYEPGTILGRKVPVQRRACRGRLSLAQGTQRQGAQADPITGDPCEPRPTCPAGFFCPHHGRKEAFSPAQVCSSLDPGTPAGQAGHAGRLASRHALLSCSFFSSRWARPLQQLHPPTLMPALDRVSYCKSTRRLMCCRQSSSRAMNPIHAQFRHAPLGMHPSLFISIPRQGHGIKPGPAAAGPSMMTGLTGHEGRRPTTLKQQPGFKVALDTSACKLTLPSRHDVA